MLTLRYTTTTKKIIEEPTVEWNLLMSAVCSMLLSFTDSLFCVLLYYVVVVLGVCCVTYMLLIVSLSYIALYHVCIMVEVWL